MKFEDWWKRNKVKWCFESSAEEMDVMIACEQAFLGGEKSRQAEIDKLKTDNKKLKQTFRDHLTSCLRIIRRKP